MTASDPTAEPDAGNVVADDASTKHLVGKAIRHAREAAGLSMRALASRCGVSQPFLSQVERGAAAPSLSTLYRVADALGTTPADLLPTRPAATDAVLIRAEEGRQFPVSDKRDAAVGRLLVAGEGHVMEAYDYDMPPGTDAEAWFASEGDLLVFVVDGRLDVVIEGDQRYELGPGDALFHANDVPHRWDLPEQVHTRVLLVVVRRRDEP